MKQRCSTAARTREDTHTVADADLGRKRTTELGDSDVMADCKRAANAHVQATEETATPKRLEDKGDFPADSRVLCE